MPLSLQAKLLRVLQEKEIVRVGGTKPIKIDVRIISATNANIEQKIVDKEFREDLYYRLNTIPIKIPPLRERRDEILDIAEEYLKAVCAKYSFASKTFSKKAKEELLSYNWPGNIRELLSVVERSAILSQTEQISENDLMLEHRRVKKSITAMEKELLSELLKENNYNLELSAKTIGISKTALQKKIKKYNLEVENEKI